MKKIRFLSIFLLIIVAKVFGQSVPPPPDALGKINSAGLVTGANPLTIPIANVSNGSLSVPISLHNKGGGVKINEIPSNLGLGWSLNAGGQISREVKGFPDDIENGFFVNGSRLQSLSGMSDNELEDFNELEYDGEADIFHFNFLGRSGRFIFDSDKILYKYELDDLQITPVFSGNSIESFTILDEKGTVYTFDKVAVSNAKEIITTWRNPINNSLGSQTKYVTYNSAWYLTSMVSANGHDVINFKYTEEDNLGKYYYRDYQGDYWVYIDNDWNWKWEITNEIEVDDFVLEDIKSTSFEVHFFNEDFRSDRQNDYGNPSWRLNGIYIYDRLNGVNKMNTSYRLGYIYSDPNSEQEVVYENWFRLMLSWVSQDNRSPYLLEYYWPGDEVSMPYFNYPFRDHWGYYNGPGNNTTLVSSAEFNDIHGNRVTFPTEGSGANREAVLEYARGGAVKKVTYPSGSSKTFTYGLNDYYDDYLNANTPSGGLRIESVATDDDNGNTSTVYYNYNHPDEPSKSSGVRIVKPYYIVRPKTDDIYGNYTYLTSLPLFPLPMVNGSYGNYEYVTITDRTNGKTVNAYETFHDHPNKIEIYYGGSRWIVDDMYSSAHSKGTLVLNNDWRQGSLKWQKVYKTVGTANILVSETIFGYYDEEPQITPVLCYPSGGYERGDFYFYRPRLGYRRLLSSKTQREYLTPTDFTEMATYYFCEGNNHFFPTRVVKDNGTGGLIIEETKYADDYSSSADPSIAYFKNNHIKGVPIEKRVWRKANVSSSSYELIDGVITTYQVANGGIVPYKEYKLEIGSPLSETEFGEKFWKRPSGGFTSLVPNTAYYKQKVEYTMYDNDFNILEVQPVYGNTKAILYGYENRLPIAEVKNARHNEIKYENYENELYIPWLNYLGSNSDWELTTEEKKTGNYSLRINNNGYRGLYYKFDVNDLDLTCDYKFSTWRKVTSILSPTSPPGIMASIKYNGGSSTKTILVDFSSETGIWEYLEGEINLSEYSDVTVVKIYLLNNRYTTGYVYFDDTRFYPSDADIVSYTYNPWVGITSQTSTNGQSVETQYDLLGRVKRILDNDGNVVKEFNYNTAK